MFPFFCTFLTGQFLAETEENLLTGYCVDRERKYLCTFPNVIREKYTAYITFSVTLICKENIVHPNT